MTPWSRLRALGESKALRTSPLWFFAVPLAARIFAQVNTISVQISANQVATFDLSLPFSWRILFYAALAFSAATLMYSVKCPSIIQDYKSYADFEEQGHGYVALREHLRSWLYTWARRRQFMRWTVVPRVDQFMKEFEATCSGWDTAKERAKDPNGADSHWPALFAGLANLQIPCERIPEAFSSMRQMSDDVHPGWRNTIAILFAVGFGLLVLVILQNVLYVVNG